jgi:hypothetical protein
MLSNYTLSIQKYEIMDCTHCGLAVRRPDELGRSKRREVGETEKPLCSM